MKLLEKYLHYRKGKMRAHEIAEQRRIHFGSQDPNSNEIDDPVERIQTQLNAEGFHIMKGEIENIVQIYSYALPDYTPLDAMFSTMLEEKTDHDRIPRLLKLNEHFAELLAISPVHPFDMTAGDLLAEVFGFSASSVALKSKAEGAFLSCIKSDQQPVLACVQREILEVDELIQVDPPIMLWPIPLVIETASITNNAIGRHSPVKHWHYRCIECTHVGKLDPVINAICDGQLPVIWAAAASESTLHLLVRVEADDRRSWEAAGQDVVSKLQQLGASSVAVPFESDIPLPGSLQSTELLYYDPELVEEYCVDLES